MNPDHAAPPLNPLPPVVWALVVPMALVEGLLSLAARGLIGGPGGVGWRIDAIRDWGFFAQVWTWMVENRRFPAEEVLRLLTFPFVHANVTHMIFSVVFLLALGKFVGEVFRAWAVAAVFFGAGAVAAVVYAMALTDPPPLIGAFPGVYGLIGAFTYILWTRLGAVNADRRRAFVLIGFLMLFQLVFGAVNLALLGGTGMDWVADLAGFAAGFALSFVVSPGGWQRVLARLRQP